MVDLIVLGGSAIFGGWSLITDPTGGELGLPYEWIRSTVFGDYLIPGTVLLVVLGFGSFVVLYGVARRPVWAWPAGVALGLATLIWLAVQVVVVQRFHPLQAFIAVIGLSFLVLLALQ